MNLKVKDQRKVVYKQLFSDAYPLISLPSIYNNLLECVLKERMLTSNVCRTGH